MRGSSQLLINEPPLQVLPSLAKKIGLEGAIILQQIHYWMIQKKAYQRDGRTWVFNTYQQWHEDNFPFWSPRIIQRNILELESRGVLIVQQFNLHEGDATKFYSIDYDNLARICGDPSSENGTTHHPKMALPPSENGTTPIRKWHHHDKEAETNTETNTERVDSLFDLLCKLHELTEKAGWQLRDKFQAVAIELNGINASPSQLKTFWQSRIKKPAINYIVSDFATWRASQSGQGKSEPPRQITQAPSDYVDLYKRGNGNG